MDKLIGVDRRIPGKANEHPQIIKYWCSLQGECPILKKGHCLENRFLGYGCVYGKMTYENGPSKRAKAYSEFVKKSVEVIKTGPPVPDYATRYLAIIGDYVYFPYAHAAMCESVPFLAHGGFFRSEKPFIPRDSFDEKTVVTLVSFRPRSMMGDEIIYYQEKSVPLFLFHLKYMMPDIYEKAVKLDPEIEKKVYDISKIPSLEANLKQICPHTVDGYTLGNKGLKVLWWDGEYVEVAGEKEAFSFFFSGFTGNDFRLKFRPDPLKTKVIITDKVLIKDVLIEFPELLKE